MARTAEARLSVTVEDSALDSHVAKLTAVKQGWDGLQQGAAALQNIVPADLVKSLKDLDAALTGANGKGAETFAKDLGAIGAALKGLPRKLDTLAAALTKVQAALASMNASQAATSLDALGTVLTTHFKPAMLNAQARAFGKVAGSTTAMGTASATAAADIRSLTASYIAAKKAGVPIPQIQQQIGDAVDNTTKKVKNQTSALKKMAQDFIRTGAALFIMYHWIKGAYELLQKSATEIDLKNTLTLSVENFADQMERAQEATQGTVTKLEMMKSAALMSSFGLPMENFAGQMQMVQKMAIRTGQSTEYLMESLARGVSRLSPMILDNLGLQISLSDAYDVYAASLGKSASALTKMEQKTAVMNEVMRQSVELTKEVDPAASLAAQNEAAMARIKNVLSDVGQAITQFMVWTFQDAAEEASGVLLQVKLIKKAMKDDNAGVAVMSALDAVNKFDPSRLSGGERLVRGYLDSVKDFLGIQKEMVVVTKEELDVREKEALLAKSKAAVSLQLYNQAVALQKLDKGHDTQTSLQAEEKLEELRYKHLAMIDRVNDLKRKGQKIDEEGYQTFLENSTSQIEFYEVLADKRRAGLNLEILLGKVAKDREGLAGIQAGMAEGASPQDLLKNLEIANMQEAVDKAIAKQRKEIEDHTLGIMFGVRRANDFTIDGLALAEKAKEMARSQYDAYMLKNAAELKALKDQQDQIVKNQYEAQGMLAIQYEHSVAEKALNAALEDYNKKLANSITLRAGETSATQEEVLAAGEKVSKLQSEVGLLKEKAKYQEMGMKAAHEVTSLDKKARDHQAYILAGYKTRAQIQATFLEVQKIVVDAEIAIAETIQAQNTLKLAGMTFLMDMAAGKEEEARDRLEKAAENLGRLKEKLDRFSKPTGGGSGGGGRDKKETHEFAHSMAKTFLKQADVLQDSGRKAATVLFTAFKDETTIEIDSLNNVLSKETKRIYDDTLQGTYDYLETRADSPSLLTPMFQYRPREVQEELEKAIKDITEFQEKALKAGALGDGKDAKIQTMLNQLEARRQIAKEEVDILQSVAKAADDTATAMQNAFLASGLDQFWGDDINTMLGGVTESMNLFNDALSKSSVDMYDMVTAAMPAIRGLTAAFTKDLKVRAGMEAAMNAAAAWAAVPVWPKVVTHATAAVMYGAIAGGAVKLPTKTTSSANKKEDRGSNKGPLHIHLYGDAMATDGERSRYLEQIMAEARAEGRV
jgi:hypothetical protein